MIKINTNASFIDDKGKTVGPMFSFETGELNAKGRDTGFMIGRSKVQQIRDSITTYGLDGFLRLVDGYLGIASTPPAESPAPPPVVKADPPAPVVKAPVAELPLPNPGNPPVKNTCQVVRVAPAPTPSGPIVAKSSRPIALRGREYTKTPGGVWEYTLPAYNDKHGRPVREHVRTLTAPSTVKELEGLLAGSVQPIAPTMSVPTPPVVKAALYLISLATDLNGRYIALWSDGSFTVLNVETYEMYMDTLTAPATK